MKTFSGSGYTKILIYKEFYQWVPMIPDFSNVFLGYYAKQTYIITGPRITGIIQKKYKNDLMEEYLKDIIG
jgi:hypothetical protein